MTDRHVFIHPGFAKTGTKTIQENLFGVHPEICSLGYPLTDRTTEINKEIQGIDGVNYKEDRLLELIQSLTNQSRNSKTIIVSNENFTINSYMRVPIAQRLKGFFPNAHIIFTIRNQIDAVKSYYTNHGRRLKFVPAPYVGKHVSFNDWMTYSLEKWHTSYLGLYDYNMTIKIYESIFGHENIHIFLLEELKDNPEEYIRNISDLLGIGFSVSRDLMLGKKSNPRDSKRIVAYHKIRHTFFSNLPFSKFFPGGQSAKKHFRRWLERGARHYMEIPDDAKTILTDRYRGGNSQLLERFDLPLAKHDYPV